MGKKILSVLSGILLFLMIALLIVIFTARLSGRTPSIFGYRIFRVVTDSMTPTLAVGDVILVKDCEPESIHNGDIITYEGAEGDFRGKTITHRVVKEPEVRDGVYYYQTRGDREGAQLDPEISFFQVDGKYVSTLPLIDKLYSFFLSPWGLISFIVLIVILFGYEMISLVVSYKTIDKEDEEYYEPKNRKPRKKRKK